MSSNLKALLADLLGATGFDLSYVEFARRVSYVLEGVEEDVPDVECDSTVRTPSEIMGKLTQLFYEREVTDAKAHIATIFALVAQLKSALAAEQCK